jgi:CheY-like chemotaxis protein
MAREHLLLVERDAKTRRLLKVSLEQAGYVVETARDGVDAVERLEDAAPALVVAATDLPKIDGYGLVRRMKDTPEWSAIPVVFLVESESIEDKIRGLELGVDEYVSKPIFVKELLSRVQVLLAKRVRQHLSTSVADTRVQGQLEDLPTIDLLESLEGGKQSGIVRIRTGQREGVVFFQDGEIVDARLKRLRGEEVIFRLLSWTHGTYEVELCDVDIDPIVESSTRALIEAGMRHAAEYHRLVEDLPPLSTVMQVNRMALRARLSDIPEEINGIIALFDGRRTLLDIIDESPFDDLSTLSTVAKLFGEELLSVVAQGPTALDRSATPLAPEPDYSPTIEEVDDTAVTMRPPSVRADPPVFIDGVGQAAARAVAEPFAMARLETESLSPEMPVGETPSSHAADDDEGEEKAPPTPPRGGSDADVVAPRGAGAYARFDEDRGGPAYAKVESAAFDQEEEDEPFDEEDDESLDDEEDDESLDDEEDDEPLEDEEDEGLDESPDLDEVGVAAAGDGSRNEADPLPDPRSSPPALSEPRSPPEKTHTPPSGVPAALAGSELELPLSERPTQQKRELDASSSKSRAEASANVPATTAPSTPSSPAESKPPPRSGGDPSRDERAKHDLTPPSGPSALSQSGVSAEFFASDHAGHQDDLPPSSRGEPVFLTEAQRARKDVGRKIVMAVVGALVAVVLFAVIRGSIADKGDDATARTAKTPVPTAAPPTTAPPVATASAPEPAPATSDGGAAPNGDDGTKEDDALPDVEDPLAEAGRLLSMGKYQDAIPMANAAIRKDPENADAYYFLATALEMLGDLEGRKRVMQECVEKASRGQYKSYCR